MPTAKERPSGLVENPVGCEISNNLKGDPLETLKTFGNKSHIAEKNRKRGPFSLACFGGYVKKVKKMKGGPFSTSFR